MIGMTIAVIVPAASAPPPSPPWPRSITSGRCWGTGSGGSPEAIRGRPPGRHRRGRPRDRQAVWEWASGVAARPPLPPPMGALTRYGSQGPSLRSGRREGRGPVRQSAQADLGVLAPDPGLRRLTRETSRGTGVKVLRFAQDDGRGGGGVGPPASAGRLGCLRAGPRSAADGTRKSPQNASWGLSGILGRQPAGEWRWVQRVVPNAIPRLTRTRAPLGAGPGPVRGRRLD